MTESALYVGKVVHQRHIAPAHVFSYRIFSMLLDLDEIPGLAKSHRLFSHNRFNLFSFYDGDHGAGDGKCLRAWVDRQLAGAGINLEGGRVALLCFPRILGYTFNPLAIYYCYHSDGRLLAIIHQVSNTFGDRHSYLIPVQEAEQKGDIIRQACDKTFHVSPFLEIAGRYRFRLRRPGDDLSVVIIHDRGSTPQLFASQTGRRRPISDSALLKLFFSHPLMTVKVMMGIHAEAFRLWRRRATFHRRPPAPLAPVSIVSTINWRLTNTSAEATAPGAGAGQMPKSAA